MTTITVAGERVPGIDWNNLWWVAAVLAAMTAAILLDDFWYLNFVHVLAGLLWTGIDLFMGFVIGPIMRTLSLEARRAMIVRLMPRMLFIMPTVSTVTTTSGWFLAEMRGHIEAPMSWWVIAALVIVAILTIQGLGILLPTNIRVYLQMRRADPDMALVGRLMRRYVRVVASQGVMQIAIIVIMARFVAGI